MDPFTAVALGTAVAGSVSKIVTGFSEKKKAKQQLRDLERAALPLNAFEGLQLPTAGAEIVEQGLQRSEKENVQALKEAGTRGVLGGIEKTQQQTQAGYQQLGAKLSDLDYQRSMAIAEEDANIEAVREARLRGQISAAANASNVATQNLFSGLGGLANVALSYGLSQDMGEATQNPEGNKAQNLSSAVTMGTSAPTMGTSAPAPVTLGTFSTRDYGSVGSEFVPNLTESLNFNKFINRQ